LSLVWVRTNDRNIKEAGEKSEKRKHLHGIAERRDVTRKT